MKKNIILATLSLLFLVSVASALETTQQNPSSYFCESVFGSGWDSSNPCGNIVDSSFDTYGSSLEGSGARIFMNYTIPSNANNIRIGIKDECGLRNVSIPQSCIINNNLMLVGHSAKGDGESLWYCYNGSSESIFGNNYISSCFDNYNTGLYEEQLFYTIGNPINLNYSQNIQLPQLQSPLNPDNEGTERTLLYCTWRIDSLGEEVVIMNGVLCPETQQNFTFTNDEDYYTQIDKAVIFWNVTALEWQVRSIEMVNQNLINYEVNIPEPSENFLNSIYTSILNTLKSILCSIFPSLEMCQ